MRFAAFAPMFGLVVTASCTAIDDVRAVAGPVPRAELEGRASPEGSALARASRAASERARAMGAEARARATAIEQERARAEQERAEREAAERAARDALATAGTDWDGFGATVAPRDDGADDDVGSIESDEASADGFAKLASRAREAWIYAEPKAKSRRLGYLRAGAVVDRDALPAGRNGCKGGWYKIAPRGFVCRGRHATLDPFDPVVEASARRPRMDGLPYAYVQSRMPTPPLYARVPSARELETHEPEWRSHVKKAGRLARDPSFVAIPPSEPMPAALLYDRSLPGLSDGPPRGEQQVLLGQAQLRSGFALLSHFEEEGRAWGVTTDLAVIPLDRTRWVRPSTFHGLALDGDTTTLPVAFVMKRHATRHARDAQGHFRVGAPLAFREALSLTGTRSEDGAWLEAKDGTWLRADDVRIVDAPHEKPSWATGHRRWVDVSILRQSLVAYEGAKPVYVTLVSTGADGLGDPEKTHSTKLGVFLVHTKHVTVTMDNDAAGDEFDLRDVPFVQYFTQGYALHGAYWHDEFGTPRSHGCVNLAPIDAAWLFGFTTPDVPEGWHAALSLDHGTLVHTHP
jgi:hypothetical protein